MQDVIDPDGNVYRYDDGAGVWRHIPGGATAAATGIDWNNLEAIGGPPDPLGEDWPNLDAPAEPPPSSSSSTPASAGSYEPGDDVIDPDGNVYRFDGAAGVWRHIPDVPTANAMAVDWNGLTRIDGAPEPLGGDWPSAAAVAVVQASQAPPASSSPASSSSSSGSFQWGGRSWGAGDLAAFVGYLAAHGASYQVWAAGHPDAAELLEGAPDDPSREQVPKSVGEALGAAIAAGASAAEAAAQAAALNAAQRKQGFGYLTPDGLIQAAKDVAAAYAAGGGTPAPAPPADEGPPERELQIVIPPDIGAAFATVPSSAAPAGLGQTWRGIIDFWAVDVPSQRAAVKSVADSLKEVFG